MANTTREVLSSLLNEEIKTIINSQESDLNFIITENVSKYEKELVGNEVFLITTFGKGTLSYMSLLQPVIINVVCNQNNVKEVLNIINLFVETYNLQKLTIDNNYIIQAYTTPNPDTKFENYDDKYAIACSFNCSFSVSSNIASISKIYIDDEETEFLSARFNYNNSNDTRPIPSGEVNAYSKSIIQFGVITITISFYFQPTNFIKDCILMTDKTKLINQNKSYNVSLLFKDIGLITYSMKVIGFFVSQTQDGIPVCEVSLTL